MGMRYNEALATSDDPMTPERWRQIKAIFDEAVDLDPASRTVLLNLQCGQDLELRREVEVLLKSDESAKSSLFQGPLANVAAMAAAEGSLPSPLPSSVTTAVQDVKPPLKERYAMGKELGRGGMSVVYIARDLQLLDKLVVVKVLLDKSNADAYMRQKFQQEMEALARIDHPGVVGVLDHGSTPEGQQFLVMQYVSGTTLRAAIKPGGMEAGRAVEIVRKAAEALSAAHAKGVWHRDLKPENIMLQKLGREEHVKVIDFGIAGIQDSQFGGGEISKIAGTLNYMAPEQFVGKACAASDTYALGVVAYELLTGEKPFGSNSVLHLAAEDKSPVAKLHKLRPELPENVRRAVLKAMSFHAGQRQLEIGAFGEELHQALAAGGETQTRRTSSQDALEIAHILFTDLVGYSLLSMDDQKEQLGKLQAIVKASRQFIEAEAAGNIISLPTGDGMALAFFGDPTAPAKCALEIAAALKADPRLKLRMGVHSGPVYRVADMNANANVSGGGINMAQRVMDSGDAGHILLSSNVTEVLEQLRDWKDSLHDLGLQEVKHGVKIHLYNLCKDGLGNPAVPGRLAKTLEQPKAVSRRVTLIAAGSAVLLSLGGYSLWNRVTPQAPVKIKHTLNYFVTVRKVREGKVEKEFRMAGERIYDEDNRIRLTFSSQKPGRCIL